MRAAPLGLRDGDRDELEAWGRAARPRRVLVLDHRAPDHPPGQLHLGRRPQRPYPDLHRRLEHLWPIHSSGPKPAWGSSGYPRRLRMDHPVGAARRCGLYRRPGVPVPRRPQSSTITRHPTSRRLASGRTRPYWTPDTASPTRSARRRPTEGADGPCDGHGGGRPDHPAWTYCRAPPISGLTRRAPRRRIGRPHGRDRWGTTSSLRRQGLRTARSAIAGEGSMVVTSERCSRCGVQPDQAHLRGCVAGSAAHEAACSAYGGGSTGTTALLRSVIAGTPTSTSSSRSTRRPSSGVSSTSTCASWYRQGSRSRTRGRRRP